MPERAALVLCGDRSPALGRCAALLPWQGQSLLSHTIEVLRAVVDEIVVVAPPGLAPPGLPARIVAFDARGDSIARSAQRATPALAALLTGLARTEAPLAFVTDVARPWLDARFVRALFAAAAAGRAAAPVDGTGVHALAAVWPRTALERAAEADALPGSRRPRTPEALLEHVGGVRPAAARLPGGAASLRRVVEGSGYLAAVRAARPGATAALEFFGSARALAGRATLRVPIGPLRDVLGHAPPALRTLVRGDVAQRFLISLDGRDFVRDPDMPVGPGERVVVLDRGAGG